MKNCGLSPVLMIALKKMRFWSFLLLGTLAFGLAGVNEAQAAVAHDAASESHTGTTGNASAASFTWTHTPVGTPRGVLVFVYTISATDTVTSVTYGGTAMTRITGGAAVDTAGEPGRVDTFFLGASIPTGAQSVVVNRTNNAVVMYATAQTQTAATDTEVTGIILLQENQALAQQSVTDGSTGVTSVRYAGAYSGLAAPPGVGANSTLLNNIDLGAFGTSTVRETTAGQGARLVGFTAATDDVAAVHLAVRERATTIATGSDPAATTIAPGAAATDVNQFTLQTATGTETVTSVTVNLSTNSGVGRLAITDASNTELGFTTSPVTGSNTISVSGMSAVSGSATTFKVRATPLSHAAMPAPAGGAYAITAPVTSWAGNYTGRLGSDTNTVALTIDNLSPANVTASSCTAGAGQNALAWTNPGDADFNSVIVLRNTAAVADTPVEGTPYAVSSMIGSSTVVCSTASTSCTDTGLTVGTAYHYKIFARDGNLNWSSGGVVPTGSPCTPGPSSFNVVNTGASPTAGLISTRIAGQDIAVDIVALNASSTLAGGFTGTVAVELVNDTGVACASMPLIKTLTSQTFNGGNAGRHPLSSGQFEANAYRQLKFRITFTGASPTVTNCSTDAFANRPNLLSFTVTDGDWETAGATRTLNNASTPGGTVHKAGRPFTITATGYNGAGTPAVTTNYAGTPTASIASHIIPTSCLNGTACTLDGGTFTDGTANDGIVSSATASYAEVGAYNMQLTDTSFAAVDAGDSTTAERYITSGTVAVGRFVPDRFSLSSGSRTPACTTGGAVLSYMDQPFSLAATLVAQNFAGATTENYHPSSGGYAPATVTWQAENANSGTNLGTRLANASATWANGSYVVNSTTATFNRLAPPPDGPYDSLQLGVQLTDPDGPVLGGLDMNAATSGACAPCTAKTVGAPISARFGRLRLQNANGSQLISMPIPMQTQYWNGSGFITNTVDNCTTIAIGNIALGNYQGNLNSGETTVTVGGMFNTGVGTLRLSAPGAANNGSVDVSVNLTGGTAGASCTAAMPASTGADLAYLQGAWCGATYVNDPTARATFGVFKNTDRLIYQRENF